MSTKAPIISIIIPVYKVEECVHRCLDSVIHQTLMDIEIICVDDGTPDSSCRIIESFMQTDDRIKLIHKENGGLSSARNMGVECASGEYVWFIDSDDYINEYACERLYGEILSKEPDIIVFGAEVFPELYADSWVRFALSPAKGFSSASEFDEEHQCYFESVRMLFYKKAIHPFIWRTCIRRAFLREQRLCFDEEVRFGEDEIFAFDMFPYARKISVIGDKLYYYCCYREGSLMATYASDLERSVRFNLDIMERILEKWIKYHGRDCEEKGLLKWTMLFVGNVISTMGADRPKYAKRFLSLLKKNGIYTEGFLLGRDYFNYRKLIYAAKKESSH